MDKNKIIIVGLVIVIIALIAGIALMLSGNDSSDSVSEGMIRYNFDSVFTMEVPKKTVFKKYWNESGSEYASFGDSKSYLEKNDKFGVVYADSPIVTEDLVKFMANLTNSSGNATVSHEGDTIVMEKTNKKSDFGTVEDAKFSKIVAKYKDGLLISVYGNDLDEIKSMANTIKIRGNLNE